MGKALDALAPVDSLVDAVGADPSHRVVFLIDEIELLLHPGWALLDNLRIAWEELLGKLAIVILGGSALRKLLASNTSPFLRSAEWLPLRGLSRDDTARLLREPCELAIQDEVVDALWEQTGGHPLLLQAVMERAVDMGSPIIANVPVAMLAVMRERFVPTLFPIWWDNLQERGQQVYRTLLSARRPVPCSEQVRVFGSDPIPWLEILETTGVALVQGEEILPRGVLFREWMEASHPLATRSVGSGDEAEEQLAGILQDVHELEAMVVRAMMRWTRDLVEYPAMFIRTDRSRTGNDRLQLEQSFQLSLLMALNQHELSVEAEALSSVQGRSDIKVRWPAVPDRRACIEIKIWGRNDYANVIGQLLGYAMPDDEFGCIVMLDRLERPLDSAYEERILEEDRADTRRWQRSEHPGSGCLAFVTERERMQGKPLRIYHFLVQLPPDSRR